MLAGTATAAATLGRDDPVAAHGAAAYLDDLESGARESATSRTIAAPDGNDVAVAEVEASVELEKHAVSDMREVQAAQRAASEERQAIAAREEQQAAQQAREQAAEAAVEQPTSQSEDTAATGEDTTGSSGGRSEPEAEPEATRQAPAPTPVPTPAPTTPAPAAAGQGGERGALGGMVNSLRGSNGLPALSRDGSLDAAAQGWAEWMASNRTLQHNPSLRSDVGSGWSRTGENIVRNTGAQGWGAGEITSWMFNWWSNSAPHRANMLHGTHTHFGVGYAMGGGGPYAVLVFGTH